MRKIQYCVKRDGTRVYFEKKKIVQAINLAFEEANEGNGVYARKITSTVMEEILRVHRDTVPTVEDIQDLVETTLINLRFAEAAKCYIRHRQKRKTERENKKES